MTERIRVPEPSSARAEARLDQPLDIYCLSHLRWDSVFQRPQHLMTRMAKRTRVFFVEEPLFHDGAPELRTSVREQGVIVATPHLPKGTPLERAEALQAGMLRRLVGLRRSDDFVLWYSTPMALGFTAGLSPALTLWDCMDELSLFSGASPLLLERERQLLARADLVFTGGQSLWEAKRDKHPSCHCFPSSIDREHFARARAGLPEPADQAPIPRPRLGYFGVIDERIDMGLLAALAARCPDWSIVLVGPTTKIDERAIPVAPNLHGLGMKGYAELPAYLSGWDVALMPFALNEATRFISPTKTPEYLAGGRPVVSTAVRDVMRPYGDAGLVEIASGAAGFEEAIARLLARTGVERSAWRRKVDEALANVSWDLTCERMWRLIRRALAEADERSPEVAARTAEGARV